PGLSVSSALPPPVPFLFFFSLFLQETEPIGGKGSLDGGGSDGKRRRENEMKRPDLVESFHNLYLLLELERQREKERERETERERDRESGPGREKERAQE